MGGGGISIILAWGGGETMDILPLYFDEYFEP